jgi:hypothetical protein
MAHAEANQIAELSKKIDVVINILLHFARKDAQFNGGKHSSGDLAVWLNGVGLGNADIAIILGTSAESIRVLLHNKKKTRKRGK